MLQPIRPIEIVLGKWWVPLKPWCAFTQTEACNDSLMHKTSLIVQVIKTSLSRNEGNRITETTVFSKDVKESFFFLNASVLGHSVLGIKIQILKTVSHLM